VENQEVRHDVAPVEKGRFYNMWEYKKERITIGWLINNYGYASAEEYDARGALPMHLSDVLNSYGKDNWELVSIDDKLAVGTGLDGYALFRRFTPDKKRGKWKRAYRELEQAYKELGREHHALKDKCEAVFFELNEERQAHEKLKLEYKKTKREHGAMRRELKELDRIADSYGIKK